MATALVIDETGEEVRPALTDKRQRFVEEYLLDFNAKQAAIRAGYSEKSALMQGSRLLTFEAVKVELTRRRSEIARKLKMTPEGVASELARLAFVNVKDFLKFDPAEPDAPPVVDVASMTYDEAAGITAIEWTGSGFKVKMDKRSALVDLAKLLGYYTEAIEVSGPNGGPVEVIDANALSAVEIAQRLAGLITSERTREPIENGLRGYSGEPVEADDRPSEPGPPDPASPSVP